MEVKATSLANLAESLENVVIETKCVAVVALVRMVDAGRSRKAELKLLTAEKMVYHTVKPKTVSGT